MQGLLTAPWVVAPLAALALSAALTKLARSCAPHLGLVDKPDGGRKLHKKPTPVIGGAAFCTAMMIVVGVAAVMKQDWLYDPMTVELAVPLFLSATLFCVLGVVDDRFALRPRTKLLGQFIASLPFACMTSAVDTVHLLGMQIHLGLVAVPFTVMWLVACSNVINLIDGLDGLAGTVGTISLLTVAALFGMQEQYGAAVIALIAAGSVGGFLTQNWPPAKVFMGDGGSLTIGFLVGALSIQSTSKAATGYTLAVPMVLISVPIFDTFMAIVRRKLNGKGIGEGDRGHIHHRLQDHHGLTRKQALLAISGLCLVMAAAALTASKLDNEFAGLAICGSVLVLLIVGRIFGYQETVLFYRHIQELGVLLADTSGVMKTRFLLARLDRFDPRTRLDIWQKVSQRVEQMGGTSLELRCGAAESGQSELVLEWAGNTEPLATPGSQWQFAYSVPREDGMIAVLEAEGRSPGDAPLQRLDDLFRLFARVCQEMPLSVDDSAQILTLPARTDAVPARKVA
ncbi:MAG TPA: MraY family glycosyltransferase [Planctomycetaceae bacterium]|nr:MraY family glycosyltransferase [Planctomycetaceae bacterium]